MYTLETTKDFKNQETVTYERKKTINSDIEIFQADGFIYRLKGKYLNITKNSRELLHLNLSPFINNKIYSFQYIEKNKFCYTLSSDKHSFKGFLQVEANNLAYWVEGEVEPGSEIVYFRRSFVSMVLMRTYASDHYNYSTNHEDNAVKVTSTASPIEEQRQSIVRTWHLMPAPRACSFKLNHLSPSHKPWFGLSIPCDLPVSATEFCNKSRTFSIRFNGYYPAEGETKLPKVYFVADLEDSYALLEQHDLLNRENMDSIPKRDFSDWWNRPIFCPSTDYDEKSKPGDGLMPIFDLSIPSFIEDVEYFRKKTGVHNFTVQIDGFWFANFGDYLNINSQVFENSLKFRQMVDQLHGMGHKVLLWFSHFAISKTAQIPEDIKDTLLKGDAISFNFFADYLFDYTHPKVRAYIKKCITFMLSSQTGCLNADGIKLDLGYLTPDIQKKQFHDPSWGTGDRLRSRVNRFICECAYEAKKDALITDTCLDGYMQTDVVRLNDEWGEELDKYIERARKAVFRNQSLIDTDGGFLMYQNKFDNWAFLAPVLGVPGFYGVRYFDGHERITERSYKYLHASWNLYNTAPSTYDMEVILDPEKNLFYRKYTSGRLKNFYSAICFNRSCLVVYSTECIRIASRSSELVEIPLPPSTITSVKAITWDNTVSSYDYKKGPNENSLILRSQDAGENYKWIEVKYELNS
ncbi:MAG: hypothetical protein GY710_23265 [Desulfobacteraceae bacterium]|nr:hypothetical protein [Desulfobacteraceae bacterium]